MKPSSSGTTQLVLRFLTVYAWSSIFFIMANLSISAINCNSLNLSASTKTQQKLKLYGIAKLRTDIILMSDIRLSNKSGISALDDISNTFRINPYRSYNLLANSTKNKRGVGILLGNKLNNTLIAQESDPDDENFLLIRIKINQTEFTIGSIYGPNANDPTFFNKLERAIVKLGSDNVILGGDWNCTWSSENIANNPDCFEMASPPNRLHSQLLNDMAERLNLSDHWRSMNPLKHDFTYSSRIEGQKNRSRIDFFLFSDNILDLISDISIEPAPQSRLFDHQAIRAVMGIIRVQV